MKSHPAVETYRMMTEDELQALADDIKVNGLIDPIITTEYEGEEVIVDGRNRYRACEIAGVEPRFEELKAEDVEARILSLNVARRHLNKGQLAVVVAKAYPEPRSLKIKDQFPMVSDFALSQARVIVRNAPALADRVLAPIDPMKFSEAFAEAQRLRDLAESDEEKKAKLREQAPDLADLVDEGKLAVSEAQAAVKERAQRAERELESKRRAVLDLLQAGYSSMTGWAVDEFVDEAVAALASDEFRVKAAQLVRPDPKRIPEMERGLAALMRALSVLTKGVN